MISLTFVDNLTYICKCDILLSLSDMNDDHVRPTFTALDLAMQGLIAMALKSLGSRNTFTILGTTPKMHRKSTKFWTHWPSLPTKIVTIKIYGCHGCTLQKCCVKYVAVYK